MQLKNHILKLKSIDEKGSPFSIFKKVTLINDKEKIENKNEPFLFKHAKFNKEFYLELTFQGYYDEPNLKICLDPKICDGKITSPDIGKVFYI